MPAIPTVSLPLDGVPVTSDTPVVLGTSDPLPDGAPILVLARGQARDPNLGGVLQTLDLSVGGTVWSRSRCRQTFPNPAYGAVGGLQLATAFLVTTGVGNTMQWVGSNEALAGEATSCRAFALDVSGIPENDGRWHVQTANSDVVVTTPVAGWTTLGSTLDVTPTRSGDYLLLASDEAVVDVTDTGAAFVCIRVVQDGVVLSGSVHAGETGFGGANRLNVLSYVWGAVVSLTGGTPYSFELQGDGTGGLGLVGHRRIRLHLIEGGLLENDDLMESRDTVGLVVPSGTVEDSTASLSLSAVVPRDFLCLSFSQMQSQTWSRTFFLIGAGPTEVPAQGYSDPPFGTMSGVTGDMTMVVGMHLETGVTTPTSIGLRYQSNAGGGDCLYGAESLRPGAGDIRLQAIRLYLADAVAGGDVLFFGANF